MKKTLLVLANNSDGLYGFRKELLEELVKTYEVYVAVPDNGYFEELREIGCKIQKIALERRGINPIKDIGLFLQYIRIIKDIKPCKIITYTIKPNIYGGIAASICKVPYAVNITGLGSAMQNPGFIRFLAKNMYKVALKKSCTVFFENAGNMDVFINESITSSDKCCLLNGAGVNLEKFMPYQYPNEEVPINFLFIGRIMREKGVEELFSVMQRLNEEGCTCVLNILGNYEENYKPIIEKKSSEGWLHYYGYKSDVRPYIANSHCVILPSYHEGMSNVLLEAAACGRPVITSNINGCKEAVIDGVSGYLCEVKSAESLYTAMKKFIKLSVESKREMGKAGRTHMVECFDKKVIVKNTIRVLDL